MFNILVTTEVSTDATTEVITTQQVTTPVVSTTQTITTEEGTTLPPTTGLEIENYLEVLKPSLTFTYFYSLYFFNIVFAL